MDILSPGSSGRDRFRMLRHCKACNSIAPVSSFLCNPLIPADSYRHLPGEKEFILTYHGTSASSRYFKESEPYFFILKV